jgi:hypothetical protein
MLRQPQQGAVSSQVNGQRVPQSLEWSAFAKVCQKIYHF